MTQQPFGQPAFGGQQQTAAAPVFGGQQQAAPQQGGSPFLTPSQVPAAEQGDRWNPRELHGATLVFTVKAHEQGIVTQNSRQGETADAIRADVLVVGGNNSSGTWVACPPEQSTVLHDLRIFQGRLIGRLKGAVGGQPILAVLQVGPITTSGHPEFYDLNEPSTEQYQQAVAAFNATRQGPPF